MQQRNRLLAEDVRDAVPLPRLRAHHGRDRRGDRRLARSRRRRGAGRHRPAPQLRRPAMSSPGPSWRCPARSRPTWRSARRSTSRTTICAALAAGRERDRAAGRALEGPHRSDLIVGHGPKEMPAKVCSTGEQKALLIGLVLAHADLVRQRRNGAAPILLLDEIAAHLDPQRRAALFDEIVALGSPGLDVRHRSGGLRRARQTGPKSPRRGRSRHPSGLRLRGAPDRRHKLLNRNIFLGVSGRPFDVLSAAFGVSSEPAKSTPQGHHPT